MSTPTWTLARVDVLHPRQRCAERAAGDLDDLERADDAAAVLGQDPRPRPRGRGSAQPVVQRRGPTSASSSSSRARDAGVGAGELEPVEDRAGVERRPADQHRDDSARAQLGDHRARRALELGDRERFADRQGVEQVVGDAAPLGRRRASPYRCPCRGRPAIASVLTISPPRRSARSRERPVLPEAVAPTTATIGSTSMWLVLQPSGPTGYGPPDEGSAMGFLDKLKKQATKAVDQHGDKVADGIDKAAGDRRQEDQGQVHRQDRDRPGQGQGRARQARRQERRRPRAAAACLTSSRRSPRARPTRADRAEPTRQHRQAGRSGPTSPTACGRPARQRPDDDAEPKPEPEGEPRDENDVPEPTAPEPGQGEAAREAAGGERRDVAGPAQPVSQRQSE